MFQKLKLEICRNEIKKSSKMYENNNIESFITILKVLSFSCTRKWIKMNENEWKWMKMNENEWKWMKMNENGLYCI